MSYGRFYSRNSEEKIFVDTLLLKCMNWRRQPNFEAGDMEKLSCLLSQITSVYREAGILQCAPFLFALLKLDGKDKQQMGALAVSCWLWDIIDIYQSTKPDLALQLGAHLEISHAHCQGASPDELWSQNYSRTLQCKQGLDEKG